VLVPLLAATPFLRGAGMPAPRWNAWLGALLGFGGIVLLTSPGSKAGWTSANIGDLLTLGCAFAFALHCMALAHTSRRIETGLLATLQIGFCTLFMAATLPLGGQVYLHMTTRLVIALLVTGVLATAAAFTIQSWAQQYLAPTHTALILAMEPVFAWVTSFLVLGERLSGRAACGAVLVLGGIAVTEFAGPQILANENSL
jgi:drug/metabolite transporter (DMT)-like permease